MIKGCNKRVIVMKNTGHDMIEEAFFILKADAAKHTGVFAQADLVKQANRILDAKGFDMPFEDLKLNVNAPQSRKPWVTPFLWGLVVGIVSMCLLTVFV